MRAVIDDIGRTAAVSVLLFFAVGTMAGCQPSGKESLRDATGGGGPDGGDVLVDARPDAGMDGAGGDVAPDSTADAGDAIGMDASDGGGTDRDGDGVPNDEDNCPDQKNKEQADRDRDDVGNPCDHLPFIHDEKNPKSFDATTEDEKNQSNDSPREGRKYGLGLPFVIDGNVGPVEDEGDIDYYSFTVDEPTVLLLRVKPKSSEMWVGSITLGYQARNANIRPALFGGGPGRNGVRSIFLPVPGAYSIAVSDLRNFLPDNQQQDVPNNGKLKYRLSASAIPLPEPKKVSVPSRQNRTFDGTLNTYQVDTSDIDDLKVDAKGVSIGQRSIHDPLVYVYDRKAERTMSYTIGQQISDTQEVSLTTKLADDRSKVTVIEGFQRQLRNTSSVVEFADATVDSEFETIQTAQNKRTDRLVWLQPGMSVDGKINQPRTAGQNKRKPDTDFYLLSTRRGQAVRVTVEPTKNSKLKPSVAVGNYFEDPQRGSRFFDRRGHKIKAPNKAGKKRSVEFLYGSRTDGEVGIRVKHGPNDGADNPVGGGDYEYTIKVETFSPSPTKIGSLPTTEKVAFGPGKFGALRFDLQNQGAIVSIEPEEPSGKDVDTVSRVHHTGDWQQITREFIGGFQFRTGRAGTYWLDLRDLRGRGTRGGKMTVKFDKISVKSLGSLPATTSAKLDKPNQADFYRFEVSNPGAYDVRVRSEKIEPRVDIFKLPSFNRIEAGFGGDEVLDVDGAGKYAVKVTALGDGTGDYKLGVSAINPKKLGKPSASTSGTIDDEPFPDWFQVKVQKDRGYQFSYEMQKKSDFDGRLRVYDPSDMDRIESTNDEALRFISNRKGPVYVALSDDDQRGDPKFQYEFEASTFQISKLSPGSSVSGTLKNGKDAAYYLVDAPSGAIEVEATASSGAWTPKTRLLDGDDLDVKNNPEPHRGLVRHARAGKTTYGVRVSARDGNRSGPLKFDIRVRFRKPGSASSESEPNDNEKKAMAVKSLPAVVDASLGKSSGGSRDSKDRFAVDLKAGQKVWAIATPQKKGQRAHLRPRMNLFDPDGDRRAQDVFDGHGTYPALFAERIDETGSWQIQIKSRIGNRNGTYYLYLFTIPSTTASETEPNNSQSSAQSLATVDQPTHVSASTDKMDPTDVFKFQLARDLKKLAVRLEGGANKHDLRLLDSSFSEIAADGPNHGGSGRPALDAQNLKKGTYYLELSRGKTSGTSKPTIVLWQDP